MRPGTEVRAFQNRRIAQSNRGRDRTHRQRDRRVPRRDPKNNANRLAPQKMPIAARVLASGLIANHAAQRFCFGQRSAGDPDVEVDPGCGGPKFIPRGFTQAVAIVPQSLRHNGQELGAIFRRSAGPISERRCRRTRCL
jgi:hypothetical protein